MGDSGAVSRRIYTHNALLGAAARFRRLAQESDEEFFAAMVSALLCALALEAALNHVGAFLVPIWDEHLKRQLSPKGKLALVTSVAKRSVDFSRRPFQSFRVLFEFRNHLAHGKTQDLFYDKAEHWVTFGDRKWPAAQWETLCTSEQAALLVEDTEQMIDQLLHLPGVDWVPGGLLSEHVAHPKAPQRSTGRSRKGRAST